MLFRELSFNLAMTWFLMPHLDARASVTLLSWEKTVKLVPFTACSYERCSVVMAVLLLLAVESSLPCAEAVAAEGDMTAGVAVLDANKTLRSHALGIILLLPKSWRDDESKAASACCCCSCDDMFSAISSNLCLSDCKKSSSKSKCFISSLIHVI
jgi:hypothetical protein